MKALRDYFALHESQPTPATLFRCVHNISEMTELNNSSLQWGKDNTSNCAKVYQIIVCCFWTIYWSKQTGHPNSVILFLSISLWQRHAGFLFACRIWSSWWDSSRRQRTSGCGNLAPLGCPPSRGPLHRSASWRRPRSCCGGHSQTKSSVDQPGPLLLQLFDLGCWKHGDLVGSCGQ